MTSSSSTTPTAAAWARRCCARPRTCWRRSAARNLPRTPRRRRVRAAAARRRHRRSTAAGARAARRRRVGGAHRRRPAGAPDGIHRHQRLSRRRAHQRDAAGARRSPCRTRQIARPQPLARLPAERHRPRQHAPHRRLAGDLSSTPSRPTASFSTFSPSCASAARTAQPIPGAGAAARYRRPDAYGRALH